jgi:Ca-dependent carbohydrate-binding module xylan-binding
MIQSSSASPRNACPRLRTTPIRRRNRLVAALALGLAAALAAGVVWFAGPAVAASPVFEAEAFSCIDGYGAFKQADSTASGGYRLKMDSAVTVTKTVSTATASTGIAVRARTDNTDSPGGAYMTVTVDGVAFSATLVNSQSWTSYPFTRSLAAGSHTVRIYFGNPEERNLYLDTVTFTEGSPPSPTATFTEASQPSPAATHTDGSQPSPAASMGTLEHAYLTGYSVEDNTPPGSRDISNPVIHEQAGGTGTYADPITLAAGHSIINGQDILDFPAGTRIYLPVLRIYGLVEDTCGDGSRPQRGPCHTGYPSPSTNQYWIDVFVGSDPDSACMDSFSQDLGWTVIRNPDPGWLVDPRPNELGARCTVYTDTPVRA